MATIVANPYYDDPFLSSIASNISRAFIDRNPGQTAAGRAQARLYGLKADEIESGRAARTRIAAQFRQLNGRSPTPEEYAVMTGDTIEGGIKPGDIAESNLFYQSNSGQPASNVARAVVGTGKTIGTNQGVTLEDRNEVAKRAEDEAARRSQIAAGPGYAGVAQREREANARLQFDKDNVYSKPVTVNPGDGVFYRPGDPRFPENVPTGSVPVEKNTADKFVQSQDENGKSVWRKATDGIPGPPDKKTAERMVQSFDENGQPVWRLAQDGLPRPLTSSEVEKTTKAATPIAGYDSDGNPIYIDPKSAPGQKRPLTPTEVEKNQKFPPTPDPSSPTGWSQRVNGEVVPVAKPATAVEKPSRPGDINSPKEVADAEWNILSKLGAVGSDGSIDPDFIAEFGDKMPGALAAIGAPGTSAGSAESTYLKALGIEPGSTWARGGWFSKPQLNKPKSKIGAAVTSGSPAPAGKQQAVPQQSVVPPPPNPADRKAGATYTTPKGLMTWTGTGWVPAGTK